MALIVFPFPFVPAARFQQGHAKTMGFSILNLTNVVQLVSFLAGKGQIFPIGFLLKLLFQPCQLHFCFFQRKIKGIVFSDGRLFGPTGNRQRILFFRFVYHGHV